MNNEIFLIDSNSFIQPYNSFYPFDFAKNFWEQLENNIEAGSIVILDMVKEEIRKGNDQLTEWINKINIAVEIDHRNQNILANYRKILEYIQAEPCYMPTALENWSQEQVADAWLIATAMSNGYTIITFEEKQTLIQGNKYRNAKIPNVAEKFDIKVENLYYLMRTLNFEL